MSEGSNKQLESNDDNVGSKKEMENNQKNEKISLEIFGRSTLYGVKVNKTSSF